ncbi:hypothetical protein BHM03_00021639, partial [Ensete ventricosum]
FLTRGQDVYRNISSTIAGVIQGLNATVFAYGSTGSSHAVLEITVKRKQRNQYQSQILRGKLALVDLAGRLIEVSRLRKELAEKESQLSIKQVETAAGNELSWLNILSRETSENVQERINLQKALFEIEETNIRNRTELQHLDDAIAMQEVIDKDGAVVRALRSRRQVILDNIRDNDEAGAGYKKDIEINEKHRHQLQDMIDEAISNNGNRTYLHILSQYRLLELRDLIVKGLGFQSEDLKVSGFDVRDALVGQAVTYEFDVEVEKRVIPIRLLEDVSRWDFVDLPIFRVAKEEEEETGLAEVGRRSDDRVSPVLPPFQLAGPMELWIQDGDDMRLSLPHDVEAGALKKVILSDGAVVTVKGAKSISLRHPIDLPLPLNRSHPKNHPVASGLLSIAEALRHASRTNQKPLLSLRIVGPTSLASSPSASPNDKLKLKRLAPGLVELSSRSVPEPSEEVDGSPRTTLWPLTSLNGSDPSLHGFEELLASVLGKKGSEEGSFRLVKAQVSAQTYVKMGFAVEKKLLDREGEVDWSAFPAWKTKPEKAIMHFEVLARVEDNGRVVPERIAEIQPFEIQESVIDSFRTGNASMSEAQIVHPPPKYFTL